MERNRFVSLSPQRPHRPPPAECVVSRRSRLSRSCLSLERAGEYNTYQVSMTTREEQQGGMEGETQHTTHHQLHAGILRQARVNPQATAVVVVDASRQVRGERLNRAGCHGRNVLLQ